MHSKNLKEIKNRSGGFSLVELMVASSLFIIVLTMSGTAVYTVFNSNLKSQNTRSVMDNLNLSLESMTRSIRFGKNYHCGSTGTVTAPQDCASATSFLEVRDQDGVQVRYERVLDLNNVGRVRRTKAGVQYYMTSPDVNIARLNFRVYGSQGYAIDRLQPIVVITINGSVGQKASTKSTFSIQTSVSQRSIDFQ